MHYFCNIQKITQKKDMHSKYVLLGSSRGILQSRKAAETDGMGGDRLSCNF